jgi:hypothetical protein
MSTQPKPFVFVLMPFDKEFEDVYKLGIKTSCQNAGAYAERVDEQIFATSILERIYNEINKADVIVADMTGRNPNVFYEVGYAHALGKTVILLTRKADDIPFDLKHYPHIVYGGSISDLVPELEKKVRWAISQSKPKAIESMGQIVVLANKVRIIDNPTVGYNQNNALSLDFHNNDEIEVRPETLQMAIITSKSIRSFNVYSSNRRSSTNLIEISDSHNMHKLDDYLSLYPGQWDSVELLIDDVSKTLEVGNREEMVIKLFSPDGGKSFPFTLEMVQL